jgi:hypothetical protein
MCRLHPMFGLRPGLEDGGLEASQRVMSTNEHSTTPLAGGQGTAAPSITRKYAFDPSKTILLDVEVFPGQPTRWCCGFQSADGRYTCVDGDKALLATVLDKIHRAGRTLIGYNSGGYDLPVLRAILAGLDPLPISQACVGHTGWGPSPRTAGPGHHLADDQGRPY